MTQSGWLPTPEGAWCILAYKYPNIPHMRQIVYPAGMLCGYPVLQENPGATCEHYTRNAVFSFSNRAFWIHQPGRRHLAVAVFTTNGQFRGFYIHITMPPELSTGMMRYVDMDLDVLIDPSGRVEVVDRDEFDAHRVAYRYPTDLVTQTEQGLEAVLRDIKQRRFPFDGSAEDYIRQWCARYLGG